MIRVALDTHILTYLAGVSRSENDEAKIARVRGLIGRLGDVASPVAPTQTLGELFAVLRRSGASAEEAHAILLEFSQCFAVPASEKGTALAAADLAVDHRLPFWDALILSAAVDAGCALLLSEDMQHGFVTRGLTVVDPLRDEMHPRLAAVLDVSV